MQKRNWLFSILTLCAVVNGIAQDDPTLFTVSDIKVPVSEFEYIYTKNNRDKADYSRASITEYLDLYTRFKLKVKRARDLELDTISALQNELAGYRAQLAKTYLNDKEVVDKLTREAYDRMHWDLHVAQILVKVPPTATTEEDQLALGKAIKLAERIRSGEPFARLAAEESDDKGSAANGGDIGYLTCLLPNGYYHVENAIYGLKDGQVSDPVRTSQGYHIFTILDRRPSRGEIEAAHIFVRVKSDSSNAVAARQKIYGVYQSLQNGSSFEELANTVSDDAQTARRGGYIGRFGINTYEPVIEEAAFALTTPGSYTAPVRSRAGWHIIKLISKYELGTYENDKNRIEARVTRDDRVNVAKRVMIEKIRTQSGMKEHEDVRDAFIQSLGDDFLTFQWNPGITSPETLVSFNDGSRKTTGDLVTYLRTKTRERMRAAKTASPQSVAGPLYDEWLNDVCIEYEEKRLEDKYPDFKALMREYEEGILLFEVTKMKVWDKASQDTVGLRAFFEAHRDDYMWPERAEVVIVSSEGPDAGKYLDKAKKLLAKKPIDQVAAKLNKKQTVISYQRKKHLREELESLGLTWQSGFMTATQVDTTSGSQSFSMVSELLPPQPKALEEARGYVIADYQDYLEQQWVEELRAMYPVVVNQDVLNHLIRKQ